MIDKTLIQEAKDQYGLVHPNPQGDQRSYNGLVGLSQWMVILYMHNQLTEADKEEFKAIVRSCYVPGKVGLLNRAPDSQMQQEHDDYTAVAVACSLLGISSIPDEIVTYGQAHSWYMNNSRPDTFKNEKGEWNFKAIHLRYPSMLAAIKLAAGYKLSLINRLALFVSLSLASSKSDPHGDALLCLMAERSSSKLLKLGARIFRRKVQEGVVQSYLRKYYYSYNQHPQLSNWHPVPEYWKGI